MGPMLWTCWIEPVNWDDFVPICNMRKLPQSRALVVFVWRPAPAEAAQVNRGLFESIGSAPKLYHAFVHHLFIARPPTHSRWILELKVYRKPQRSQKTSWTGWRLLATVGSAVSYGHTVIHFHCNRSRRSLVMLGIMWQGSTESIAQLTQ